MFQVSLKYNGNLLSTSLYMLCWSKTSLQSIWVNLAIKTLGYFIFIKLHYMNLIYTYNTYNIIYNIIYINKIKVSFMFLQKCLNIFLPEAGKNKHWKTINNTVIIITVWKFVIIIVFQYLFSPVSGKKMFKHFLQEIVENNEQSIY
jgi:hypothetical protein